MSINELHQYVVFTIYLGVSSVSLIVVLVCRCFGSMSEFYTTRIEFVFFLKYILYITHYMCCE